MAPTGSITPWLASIISHRDSPCSGHLLDHHQRFLAIFRRLLWLQSAPSRVEASDLDSLKERLTCSEYLLHLRCVVDELAFIGAPLPEDELVSATINGLGIEYNSIVAVVSTACCSGSLAFSYLQGLLLGHEALLKSQIVQTSSAFYVGKGGNNQFRNQLNPNQTRSVMEGTTISHLLHLRGRSTSHVIRSKMGSMCISIIQ
jgi:hypothetical protein